MKDDEKTPKGGIVFVGDRGRLYAPGDYGGQGYRLLDGATDKAVEFPASPGHFVEFAQAIKEGKQSMSNFPDYAGPLTETVLLGNLAVWAGTKVEWDARAMKAKNMPELDALIKPTYRVGYSV